MSEIAKNPGFETVSDARKDRKGNKYGVWKITGTHEASSWSLNDAHPGRFELITSRDGEARSGRRFIRIEAQPKRAAHIYQRTSAIRPKAWYLYSAWARGGGIELPIYEYSGKTWLRTQTIKKAESSEGRWTRVWALYQVPAEEVSTLGLAVAIPAGSTTDVDDVSFRPVAKADAITVDGRTIMTIPEPMVERGQIAPPRIPRVTEEWIGEDMCLSSIRTNVLHYKCAAASGHAQSVSIPLGKASHECVELAFAECAAFGLRVLPFDGDTSTKERYRKFIASQPRLFQGARSASEIAVLYAGQGGAAHIAETAFVVSRLSRSQVPFDIVEVENLAPGRLGRYKILIVPYLAVGDEKTVRAVKEFVQKGGALVASGDIFRKGIKGSKRSVTLLDEVEFEKGRGDYRRGSLVKGKVFHVPGQFDAESLWQGIREGIPEGPILIVRRVREPVRLNALAVTDGSLVLHFVNYGVTGKRKQTCQGLPVLARIPRGRKGIAAIVYGPNSPDEKKIPFTQYGDQVFCRIPEIKTYLVLEIRLGGGR